MRSLDVLRSSGVPSGATDDSARTLGGTLSAIQDNGFGVRKKAAEDRLQENSERMLNPSSDTLSLVRAGRHIGQCCSAGSARIRATSLPGRRIYLDSGLLGVRQRLLLGPWCVGATAQSGSALDTAVVGLEQRRLRL